MASAPNYTEQIKQLRDSFNAGITRDIAWRRTQLQALIRMLDEKADDFVTALYEDLHKCKGEAMLVEVNFVRSEAVHHLDNLEAWTKPQPVKKDILTMMDTCYLQPQPLGVALIMGAWNYPVQVTLLPLVGAISAGNCVIVKPSEMAPKSAQLMADLIEQYLDPKCIKVVQGGIPETTSLLKERFDHIFYTGNSTVGKIVMTAAAKHLTSVTLELGGKSPCYIDKSSNLELVARRLIWGKLMNCGQTCIAPDYLMCSSEVQKELLPHIKKTIIGFYGEDPQKSADYARIINERHFNRITKLFENAEVYYGGKTDAADKYISPTIVVNVKPTDPIMMEEVFGPVLPVLTMETLTDAVNFINDREKPLAAYIFSTNKEIINKFTELTTSGGMCINDVVMQGSLNTIPFGGVGNSGTGAYHGKYTFDSFCHHRGVMVKGLKMESANELRYPPYSEKKYSWSYWLMKKNPKKKGILSYIPFMNLGN